MLVLRSRHIRCALGVFLASGVLSLAAPPQASAEGFFEAIFGGLRRMVREPPRVPASVSSYADPRDVNRVDRSGRIYGPAESLAPSREGGPSTGYCVRTCDGFHFPVQTRGNVSAADMCRSFCPAAETKVYSGSVIDRAVSSDGKRYADLANAFVYRQHLVNGCTCNGKTSYGLAKIDPADDPTIRPGDIVATKDGLTAFKGFKNRTAEFTPIDDYRGLAKAYRDKLADIKVAPAHRAVR